GRGGGPDPGRAPGQVPALAGGDVRLRHRLPRLPPRPGRGQGDGAGRLRPAYLSGGDATAGAAAAGGAVRTGPELVPPPRHREAPDVAEVHRPVRSAPAAYPGGGAPALRGQRVRAAEGAGGGRPARGPVAAGRDRYAQPGYRRG